MVFGEGIAVNKKVKTEANSLFCPCQRTKLDTLFSKQDQKQIYQKNLSSFVVII